MNEMTVIQSLILLMSIIGGIAAIWIGSLSHKLSKSNTEKSKILTEKEKLESKIVEIEATIEVKNLTDQELLENVRAFFRN